jgi:hypothetical protein
MSMDSRTHRPTAARLLTAVAMLLLVLSIATGLFLVGSRIAGAEAVAHARVSADQLDRLPEGVVSPSEVQVAIRVKDPSASQQALAATKDIAMVGLFALGIWLTEGVLRSAGHGDPFVRANVRRLRLMGYLLVIGAPIVRLIESLVDSALLDDSGVQTNGVHVGVSAPILFAGLGVFALAQVFAHGVALREDVEGTV